MGQSSTSDRNALRDSNDLRDPNDPRDSNGAKTAKTFSATASPALTENGRIKLADELLINYDKYHSEIAGDSGRLVCFCEVEVFESI